MQLSLPHNSRRCESRPGAADLQIDLGRAIGGRLGSGNPHHPRHLQQALHLRVALDLEAVSRTRSPASHGCRSPACPKPRLKGPTLKARLWRELRSLVGPARDFRSMAEDTTNGTLPSTNSVLLSFDPTSKSRGLAPPSQTTSVAGARHRAGTSHSHSDDQSQPDRPACLVWCGVRMQSTIESADPERST